MIGLYYKQLEGRLFTKNGQEYPRYGVGGLRYRSTYSLKMLLSLEVNDKCVLNNSVIQRVK